MTRNGDWSGSWTFMFSSLAAWSTSSHILGTATKDHATLRALSALIASLPASQDKEFREEFDTVSGHKAMLQTIFHIQDRNMKMFN